MLGLGPSNTKIGGGGRPSHLSRVVTATNGVLVPELVDQGARMRNLQGAKGILFQLSTDLQLFAHLTPAEEVGPRPPGRTATEAEPGQLCEEGKQEQGGQHTQEQPHQAGRPGSPPGGEGVVWSICCNNWNYWKLATHPTPILTSAHATHCGVVAEVGHRATDALAGPIGEGQEGGHLDWFGYIYLKL